MKTKNAYAAVLAQAKQKRDEQARQDSRMEASKAIFYAEGLLDPEFLTMGDESKMFEKVARNNVGAFTRCV